MKMTWWRWRWIWHVESRQHVPGWGRWGLEAVGVGSSRWGPSGSGRFLGLEGSSPAGRSSAAWPWWAWSAPGGQRGSPRGHVGRRCRGHEVSGRGPGRDGFGFHSCQEDSCGGLLRWTGASGRSPWCRGMVGWPWARTWRRRGAGWGPLGRCPRSTVVPAWDLHSLGEAGMPVGRWRTWCRPGWLRRRWQAWHPWRLQRPGGVGWAWPSAQVGVDSCRISICGRVLPQCRGRSSSSGGCLPCAGWRTGCCGEYRCTGRR